MTVSSLALIRQFRNSASLRGSRSLARIASTIASPEVPARSLITDLHVHLIQRFLHVLQMDHGQLDQIIAVPPQRTDSADFLIRPKRAPQQATVMQV